LSKNWRANINMGSTWRPPVVSELYSNGLHHGAAAVEIGNADLLPENAYSITAAIAYQTKQLSLKLSPYLNYINNFIYLSPGKQPTLTIRGAFPTFYYEQVNAQLKGIDFNGE